MAEPNQEFGAVLRFLAGVRVRLNPPVFVGESPEGVRIDVIAAGGTVTGEELNGVVVPGSSDHLFVRPDGIGILRIRAIFALHDGAMIEVEEKGSVDFGSNGYALAAEGRLPRHSQVVSSTRLLTGAARYSWLNRTQCIGIGRTNLHDLSVAYDLFTVQPGRA